MIRKVTPYIGNKLPHRLSTPRECITHVDCVRMPPHHALSQYFKFDMCKLLCTNTRSVVAIRYFLHGQRLVGNLMFEVAPFNADVFGVRLTVAVTVIKNNTVHIVLVKDGGGHSVVPDGTAWVQHGAMQVANDQLFGDPS
jgi:hypothetical protein